MKPPLRGTMTGNFGDCRVNIQYQRLTLHPPIEISFDCMRTLRSIGLLAGQGQAKFEEIVLQEWLVRQSVPVIYESNFLPKFYTCD